MKATALLERQHRKVESLFNALEAGKKDPAELVNELACALTAHAVIEEEMFYPLAKRVERELVLQSRQEHDLATYALKRLVAARPESDSFMAKLMVTKEAVAHHVKEEEEELFPAMEESLGEEENEALGRRMEARFKELQEAGYEGALAARKARRTRGDGEQARGDGQRARGTEKRAGEAGQSARAR